MNGGSKNYLITGCSGGGKSTLAESLARQGFAVKPEAGRQIVEEELAKGGKALPWGDGEAFGMKLVEHTLLAFANAGNLAGPIFWDRGIPDTLAWFDTIGVSAPATLMEAAHPNPYAEPVFVLPPWQEIYTQDAVRQKSFAEAVAEFGDIEKQLSKLGWPTVEVPRGNVEERITFVKSYLD